MTTFIIAIIVIAIINNSLTFVTPVVTVEAPAANRRTLKRNAAKRRTRCAAYAHRVERRLRKGIRCTSQPTQTKRQAHWHVPEAPQGATPNRGVNSLARRFNSAVNNLKARRSALKRRASELMEFDPEYMFT